MALSDPAPPPDPSFGTIVAAYQTPDQNLAFVCSGAPRTRWSGQQMGTAYIYSSTPTSDQPNNFNLEATLTSENITSNSFGDGVVIDQVGGVVYVAVTDSTQMVNGLPNVGRVYLFKRTVGPIWVNVDTVTPTNPAGVEFFGASIDIGGGHIVVGAPGDNFGGGKTYFYDISNDKLVLRAEFNATGTFSSFGQTVAMGGNYALSYAAPAIVYFFEYTTQWANTDMIAGTLLFGSAFDVDGDGVAAIADADNSGTVTIYEVNTNGKWAEKGVVAYCPTNPCPPGFNFGADIALAPGYVLFGANDSVVLFSRNGPALTGLFQLYPGPHQSEIPDISIDFFGTVGVLGVPLSGAAYPFYAACQSSKFYGANCTTCPSTCTYDCYSTLTTAASPCLPGPTPNDDNTGTIVGAIFGVIILLALIGVGVWYYRTRSGYDQVVG